MNGQRHIPQEDLALYALGALDGDEEARVRKHLQECGPCHEELMRVREALALLALSTESVPPPPGARGRLLATVAPSPRPVRTSARFRGAGWLAVLAPAFAAVALAVFSVVLWQRNGALERRINALQREQAAAQSSTERATRVLALLESPDATRVTLAPPHARPEPEGRVLYQQRTGALLFVAGHLTPLPATKAYELWVVPAHGAPIPAGVFRPDARGGASVVLPSLPAGVPPKAFAVTVEKADGSETPTMPMVLAGQ